MDKKSNRDDSEGQRVDDENEHKDDEHNENKNLSEYMEEDSKGKHESEYEDNEDTNDEEDIKSKNKSKYGNEKDLKSTNESLYKDEEDVKSKEESEYNDYTESEKESENKDEQDSKSEKESRYQDEENIKSENEKKESKGSKEKDESKDEQKSNGKGSENVSHKRKLSFLSFFSKISDEDEMETSENEEFEEEMMSSSKAKRKSSLLSLFSLKPKDEESKTSDSRMEKGESEYDLKSDEQAGRKGETSGNSSDAEKGGGKPAQPRKTSAMKRQFLAMEMELQDESISKKITSIFSPVKDRSSADEGSESVHESKRVYLSTAMAAMFIVSASTGGAIKSMPYFLLQSSWFGIFLLLLLGFNAIYSGLCTGWSWEIMVKIWPEYSEYRRVPYQDIASRAVGTWMKYLVAISVDVTLIVTCACYLVFIAEGVGRFTGNENIVCVTIIVSTLLLTPFSMYGTYSDMKWVGLLDVILSVLYVLFVVICIIVDKSSHGPVVYSDPTPQTGIAAFAGMSFAYGVGAVLPTIVVEMADRSMFTQTCVTAYMVIIAMYIVLTIIGYAAYGDETPTAILNSIYTNNDMYYVAVFIDLMNTVQLSTTFLCAILPSMLAFEERFKCPDRFCVGRVCIRAALLLFLLMFVLAVPFIPKFMVLMGATTMNLLTFILPPVFYVCLVYKWKSKSSRREMNKKAWILIVEIVLLGVTIGVISIYVAIEHYANSVLVPRTCFTNITVPLLNETERVA